MHMIQWFPVLAASLLGILAVENFNGDRTESTLETPPLIDVHRFNPAERLCANRYNNGTQQINQLLISQTNGCFETSKSTTATNNRHANQNVAGIRNDTLKLQETLSECTNFKENLQFLSCITRNFDSNLLRVDRCNSQAHQIRAEIDANQTIVNTVRRSCISSAVDRAKGNLTQAANKYARCLDITRSRSSGPGFFRLWN